jgi:large subunit ribosomal protein L20
MTRVTRGFVARRRRNKILKNVSGCQAGRSRLFRVANQQNLKSHSYMYSSRKQLKRTRRQLWIKRINGAIKISNVLTRKSGFEMPENPIKRVDKTPHSYNIFMYLLKKKHKSRLNRKSLAQLASVDPRIFQQLVKKVFYS